MWFVESSLSYFQKFCVNVIKAGQVPRHIAFIMDGNRRHATKNNMKKVEGHVLGFHKLAETMQWCFEMGIQEITVFAFSIDNWRRSQEEIDFLMELARGKFSELLEEKERLMSDGIRVRIIGNLALLPKDIQKLIAEVMLITKDNNKLFLNLAVAYTSRDELTTVVKDVVQGVELNLIGPDDVNEQLMTDCLFTNSSPDPDLFVRTSGEVRFSGFLLWQIWNANIRFAEVLWPDFSIWHLLASVFQYQRCYNDIQKYKKEKIECSPKAKIFLERLKATRSAQIELYANA